MKRTPRRVLVEPCRIFRRRNAAVRVASRPPGPSALPRQLRAPRAVPTATRTRAL